MSAAPASGTARPARSLGSAIRGFADQPEFKQLSILILTAFVDMIGFSIVFPLMPFYAVKFNASPTMVGLLISSYSIAQLLTKFGVSGILGKFSTDIATTCRNLIVKKGGTQLPAGMTQAQAHSMLQSLLVSSSPLGGLLPGS